MRVNLIPALIALKRYADADAELRTAREKFQRAHDTIDGDRSKLRERDDALATARKPSGRDRHALTGRRRVEAATTAARRTSGSRRV